MDMIGSMSGDVLLGRRLGAYAEMRLSPDLATSSRLRARVLAVAHRRAALARADAGLTVLSRPQATADARPFSPQAQERARASARPRRRPWRRMAAVALAASLGTSLAVGGVAAARPAGPLYHARLWAETLTLPADPSARALAELDRLKQRLREIAEASSAGDEAGATAALAAYERIVEQASASAILAGDEVAAVVLETGVGRNVEVLRALMSAVPTDASAAISRAVDAAIARSADAVERIGASRTDRDPGNLQQGAAPGPTATKAPPAKPAAAPADDATAKPKATPKATPEPTPHATPEPTPQATPPQPDDEGGPKLPASRKPGHGRGLTSQTD
jgi:hypothetical protein